MHPLLILCPWDGGFHILSFSSQMLLVLKYLPDKNYKLTLLDELFYREHMVILWVFFVCLFFL